MARKLTLGGKAPQAGNNVSHSHMKTRRKWKANIQTKSLYSETMNRTIRVTIPASELRNVDNAGGLDRYLLAAPGEELSGTMRRLQTQIRKRTEAAA